MRRYVRLPGSVDEPFLMIDLTLPAGDRERWVHQNRLGSVVLVSDAAGATRETHTYSPYGASGADGDAGFPFRFTGQKLDAETGLYFFKARYYSPALGRFLQTDPVGYTDQMNLYAYVGNDPLNGWDPTGLCETNDRGEIIGCDIVFDPNLTDDQVQHINDNIIPRIAEVGTAIQGGDDRQLQDARDKTESITFTNSNFKDENGVENPNTWASYSSIFADQRNPLTGERQQGNLLRGDMTWYENGIGLTDTNVIAEVTVHELIHGTRSNASNIDKEFHAVQRSNSILHRFGLVPPEYRARGYGYIPQ